MFTSALLLDVNVTAITTSSTTTITQNYINQLRKLRPKFPESKITVLEALHRDDLNSKHMKSNK